MTEEKKLEPELRFPGFHEPWEEKKLGEIAEFYSGGTPLTSVFEYYNPQEVPWITSSDLNKKRISCVGKFISKKGFKNSSAKRINKGMLVIALYGATAGVAAISNIDAAINQAVLAIDINKKSTYYLFTLLNRDRIKLVSKYTQGGQPNLSSKIVKDFQLQFPSLQEQEKIGKFFYAIDKKLDLQRERIEELKSYKKGMMQRIFDQEIRFKDEDGKDYPDWEDKKLGDIFSESNERLKDVTNKNKYSELLSVTLNSGIKKQSELGIHDNSSKDKSNYKIVKKDYIVYNSMRMWQGASGKSNYFGIVSSAYVVMKPKIDILPDFIEMLFKQDLSIYQFYKYSQGMTSDTLTLKYNLIKNIYLTIPSLPEQEKIANFLSAIDRRIELEEEKLELYEDFKKGLMQRMFV